ncbi:MAG TPA: 50S ribosomal protein L25/general stress protein Ctc [bacterium]|nr:50S ribosomal protein L25/general stress protein Ctc [bacterium]
MQQVDLNVEIRNGIGKGSSHRLRADGRVPGVLYGRGQDNLNLSVSRKELYNLVHGEGAGNTVVKILVAGQDSSQNEQISIVRDVQYDPVTEKIIHVDFQRISLDEPIHAEIPIHFLGTSIGVKSGGVLEHIIRTLEVECLPLDVPNFVEVDISSLTIGQSIHVRDITAPERVTIKTSQEQTIATVAAPTVVAEPVAEAAPAEGATAEEGKTEEQAKE